MKRLESSDGFMARFTFNLLWEIGWGIASMVLLVLRFLTGLSGVYWCLALAAWIVIALVKTGLIAMEGQTPRQIEAPKPNKNPYSAREGELVPRREIPALLNAEELATLDEEQLKAVLSAFEQVQAILDAPKQAAKEEPLSLRESATPTDP